MNGNDQDDGGARTPASPPDQAVEAAPGHAEDGGARCAVHPDLAAAAGTCERCGNFMCGGCLSAAPNRRLCVGCFELSVGKGRVAQLPVLGILMAVHGGLLLALGLMNLATYLMMFPMMESIMTQSPDLSQGEAEGFIWAVLAATGLASVASHFIPGILQIVAGVRVRKRKSRTLAIVGLVFGLASMLGCYCFPTSLAMLVWGMIVLLDPDVQVAMRHSEAL